MPDRKDDTLLENHIIEEMQRYDAIETRLGAIEGQMGELIDLWKQAKGVVVFIKIVASIAAAVAAVYAFLNGHFHITTK